MSDIITFANEWTSDPLSKKQVMVRFARKHRILWVNSINNRRPRLAKKDMARVFQKLRGFRRGLTQVQDNIWTLSPLFIPLHGNKLFQKINRWLLGYQIRSAARRLGLKDVVTWTYSPTTADVVGTLNERAIVYHCVDEYSAFTDAAAEVAVRERELLRKSDMVICSASRLVESKQGENQNIHLVTHGVDFEHFRTACDPSTAVAPELKDLPKPVLGFHGLIADWVDLELIAKVAKARPQWSIVLVGKVDTDRSALNGLKNVHLVGQKPYASLPQYLRGFDIAILPFVCNELTFAANPLKLREYLGAGLPVISAPLPECLRLGELIHAGSTAEDYIRITEQLTAAGDVGPQRRRSELMVRESWDYKVEEMERLLQQLDSGEKRRVEQNDLATAASGAAKHG